MYYFSDNLNVPSIVIYLILYPFMHFCKHIKIYLKGNLSCSHFLKILIKSFKNHLKHSLNIFKLRDVFGIIYFLKMNDKYHYLKHYNANTIILYKYILRVQIHLRGVLL